MMNLANSRQSGFAMPIYRDAVAFAGAKRRPVDVAPVCGHTATTDASVLGGAFPGTSAWSPPT